MTPAEQVLCAAYAVVALLALIGTQWALEAFVTGHRNGGVGGFLSDLHAGPAATFTTIDLSAVAVAAVMFMIVEGRRIGLRWLWAYVALVFVVAVSVALPLFLVGRTWCLAQLRADNHANGSSQT